MISKEKSNLKRFQDLIEQIFEVVIADGKGIELNTSSRAYKLKSLMPSKEILKLYHDMGGKIITMDQMHIMQTGSVTA